IRYILTRYPRSYPQRYPQSTNETRTHRSKGVSLFRGNTETLFGRWFPSAHERSVQVQQMEEH
ncbi:MAG TPA: hypothetical protein VED37_11610, partial [Ktedonobacteraceae bacterium]|nr:hypothetical protein [Ktedonobacteraceae bacterium]